ncbi:MAG: outer membrane beta-barrel protein [Holophaga sp.]|nr:outer membrane beta-barrel protein [Holophaga sp.]
MKKLLNRSLRSLLGILLAGSALGAADLSWGLQLSMAAPVGDLKSMTNSNLGGDLKGYGLVDLGQGHTLRPQLDALAFSGKPGTLATPYGNLKLNNGTIDVTMASLGADYLYFINGDPGKAGAYGGAGMDVSVNKVKVSNSATSVNATSTKAAYSLVGGYQFNAHWNVEASYRYSSWATSDWTLNQQPISLRYTLPTYLLGAGYRF